MVIPVTVSQLIPGGSFPQRHPVDDVEILEETKSPVHRGKVDVPMLKRSMNFLRPQRIRLRTQDGEDRRPGLRPEVSLCTEETPDVVKCLIHSKLQMICKNILAQAWRESRETNPDLVHMGKACIISRHHWTPGLR